MDNLGLRQVFKRDHLRRHENKTQQELQLKNKHVKAQMGVKGEIGLNHIK